MAAIESVAFSLLISVTVVISGELSACVSEWWGVICQLAVPGSQSGHKAVAGEAAMIRHVELYDSIHDALCGSICIGVRDTPPPPPRAHWASTYTELFFLLRLPRFSIVHKQPALSLTITVDNADQPERAPDGQRRLHVTEAKG